MCVTRSLNPLDITVAEPAMGIYSPDAILRNGNRPKRRVEDSPRFTGVITIENRLLILNVSDGIIHSTEMSENEKRVPVKVHGAEESGPPSSSSTSHIAERDQKFKGLSRLFARAPAQFAGARFPSKRMGGDPSSYWRQYADLFDSGKDYRVVVEVPGVPKDQIYIGVTDKDIKIERVSEPVILEGTEGSVLEGGANSRIMRKVTFSEEVVANSAEATLNNGVLEVRIPKKTPTEGSKHKVLVR